MGTLSREATLPLIVLPPVKYGGGGGGVCVCVCVCEHACVHACMCACVLLGGDRGQILKKLLS